HPSFALNRPRCFFLLGRKRPARTSRFLAILFSSRRTSEKFHDRVGWFVFRSQCSLARTARSGRFRAIVDLAAARSIARGVSPISDHSSHRETARPHHVFAGEWTGFVHRFRCSFFSSG